MISLLFGAKFNLKQGYNRVYNILIVKKVIDNLDILPSAALDSMFCSSRKLSLQRTGAAKTKILADFFVRSMKIEYIHV